MTIEIREMQIGDYNAVIDLWRVTEGIGLSSADERSKIAAYLEHNPGLSFCAWEGETLVGAVLCGHDGRRGYLHHLAVAADCRGQGAGRRLVEACLEGLHRAEIEKCHLFVYRDNAPGIAFWERVGWRLRHDLQIMSVDIGADGR